MRADSRVVPVSACAVGDPRQHSGCLPRLYCAPGLVWPRRLLGRILGVSTAGDLVVLTVKTLRVTETVVLGAPTSSSFVTKGMHGSLRACRS